MRLYSNLSLRLSLTAFMLFITMLVLINILPSAMPGPVTLVLLVVSLVLYVAYLLPLLISQRRRIEKLDYYIGIQATILYRSLQKTIDLPRAEAEAIRQQIKTYTASQSGALENPEANKEYFQLLRLCSSHRKQITAVDILNMLNENEANRTSIAALAKQRIFAHEWLLMVALSALSTVCVLTLSYQGSWEVIGAGIVATGIMLPLFMLGKTASLDHKKATALWQPFSNVLEIDYRKFE